MIGSMGGGKDNIGPGPAVAIWDILEQRLLECNDAFSSLFGVVCLLMKVFNVYLTVWQDRSRPFFLSEIADCPSYFLRKCAALTVPFHEKSMSPTFRQFFLL